MYVNTNQPATRGTGGTDRLDQPAVEFIKMQATEDGPFGSIDGGNLGLSAYRLSPPTATRLLAAAKEICPGSRPLQSARFDPTRQQMLAVLTSDDEPHVHIAMQSKSDGACQIIGDVNAVYFPDLPEERFQEIFPRVSRDADWDGCLTSLFSKESYLSLGDGAAERLWWT